MIRHLYLHIPFCHRICPYCGFYKHLPGRADYAGFTRSLLQEAAWLARRHELRPETVYFGGGTPSILPTRTWTAFATSMRETVDLSQLREWTLEANPATFGAGKAAAWRESGVNRISLGVQSFSRKVLKTLGRDHGPDGARQGLQDLREAGFENVNVDLMFSIPGQSETAWRESLEEVVESGAAHVSAYNLTYEEDTEFLRRAQRDRGTWSEDPDRDARMFLQGHETLTGAGFDHYEVSNYARPGFRSLHNQAYWSGEEYAALGPGAISTADSVRATNWTDTERYQRQVHQVGHGRMEEERLTDGDLRTERIALGLRTAEGIDIGLIPAERAAEWIKAGRARRCNGRIRLTIEGMMVADDIAADLI